MNKWVYLDSNQLKDCHIILLDFLKSDSSYDET